VESTGRIEERWYDVADTALDRHELGEVIESRFDRSEIERINRAVEETRDRWRTRQLDQPTDGVGLRFVETPDNGWHRRAAV
jgi:hypothetical protein